MKIKTLVTVFLTLICLMQIDGQIYEYKNWCKSKCDAAGDEMANTKSLFMEINNRSNSQTLRSESVRMFPLRITKVSNSDTLISKVEIENTIEKLNNGFENANVEFYVEIIDFIESDLRIEDLPFNNYQVYNDFSAANDKQDLITVYIFDYDPNLCNITPTSISCGRTSGFSYILSRLTNNIVLSRFDLEDDKVIVHEMGHFFGLYHTFEEDQFGKDNFLEDCNIVGDCICDTPPDPGPVFEVYVNYSRCRMIGFKNVNGQEYDPLLNNYMSYYKPCYLERYAFTQGQADMINFAAGSEFRIGFSRKK